MSLGSFQHIAVMIKRIQQTELTKEKHLWSSGENMQKHLLVRIQTEKMDHQMQP